MTRKSLAKAIHLEFLASTIMILLAVSAVGAEVGSDGNTTETGDGASDLADMNCYNNQ